MPLRGYEKSKPGYRRLYVSPAPHQRKVATPTPSRARSHDGHARRTRVTIHPVRQGISPCRKRSASPTSAVPARCSLCCPHNLSAI